MNRVCRGVLTILSFFAGLTATAGMIGVWAPPIRVPEYSEKLAHLTANAGKYDVLFLGSSRVRRQISPRIFDQVMAENGRAVRSYNFGLDGLGFPEILYATERILETKPARLRYVFVELTRFSREFGPLSQVDSKRTIYWHTSLYTAAICRAIWEDPAKPSMSARLSLIGEHLQIMVRRSCNLGRGAEWVEEIGRKMNDKVGPEGTGFFPVHERFPENRRADYERQVADLPEMLKQPAKVDPFFEELTLELLAKLERAGVTPVIVTMPRVHPASPWVPAAQGSKWMELRFDDPRAEPELFAPEMHYDAQHLNAEGAKVFSRRLAERFTAALRQTGR